MDANSESSAPEGHKLTRINTHLKPAVDNHDQGNESTSRPVTPTVREESPHGNTRILHRDGDTEGRTGQQCDAFQNRERSGSRGSFSSIKTIEDLGFTNQAAASSTDPATTQASAELGSAAAQESLGGSNSNLIRHDGKSPQVLLSDHLREHYIKSKALQCLDKEFLPFGNIKTILSLESVKEVLVQEIEDISKDELDRLSRQICSQNPSRGRVFALLLLVEEVPCIRCFIECDVDDTDLPFIKVEANQDHKSGICSRKDGNKRLKCFDKWKRKDQEWILTQQYVVAPPFFDFSSQKPLLYDLPDGTILPFTTYEQVDAGGYANVFKVSIHPDHHNFASQGDPREQYFAVKTLNGANRKDYDNEVEVLQRFSDKDAGHEHLINLLLTYMFKHKGSYHMIFPWADGGNLTKLWESMQPEQTQPFVCWMLSQYHGIADGLREIHGNNDNLTITDDNQLQGRHGDIKAENILWFKEYGGKKNHLRISDFGLSRLHRVTSVSAEAGPPGYTPSYRPPECSLPTVTISLPYDIWTLGCLLLDFLTWYLLGWEGVEHFTDDRLRDEGWIPYSERTPEQREEYFREQRMYHDKFFIQRNEDRDGAHEVLQLKSSVIKWMESLHGLDKCPQFAHDVLDMIHKGLLQPNKTKRWKSSEVVSELKRIWTKCEENEAYCCTPQPWKGRKLEVYIVPYNKTKIESLAAKLDAAAAHNAEATSLFTLTPDSGPSRASSPTRDHQSPSQSQEDLGTESQGAIPADVNDPSRKPPPSADPHVPGDPSEAGGSLNLAEHSRRTTERSLGPPETTTTGFSSRSSAHLVGRTGSRRAETAMRVARGNKWQRLRQWAKDMCSCFS